MTRSAIALASSSSVLIRALQLQEGFFNSKSRSRERFDMISDMSNPALQVVLKGVNPGGSDASEKEKATALVKPWQSKERGNAISHCTHTLFWEEAQWHNFAEMKQYFGSVDSVGNQHYVFNISGNKYRLVVVVKFVMGYVFIRFVGTHKEYDKIDAASI